MLFKSEGIADSMKNQEAFETFVNDLDSYTVEVFYKNIDSSDAESSKDKVDSLINQSLVFFKGYFGNSFAKDIASLAKVHSLKAIFLMPMTIKIQKNNNFYSIALKIMKCA